MSLMKKISQDMTTAMKARDQARLAPLRMVKAALMNREVEKGRALDEAEAQQVVASLIKQRRDSIEQFTKGGRPELAAKEELEASILEGYLPRPLTEAELRDLVNESIAEVGATSKAQMGAVMKVAMAKSAGRADGRALSSAVSAALP